MRKSWLLLFSVQYVCVQQLWRIAEHHYYRVETAHEEKKLHQLFRFPSKYLPSLICY